MVEVRVVLVEPQIPANLGFCARALANFGVTDWGRVGGCAVADTEAERTGAPALETLAALRSFASLDQALADCDHAIALTARGGRDRPTASLTDLGEHLATWGSHCKVALVFGREDRGLENEEVQRCSSAMCIATANGGLSSLNLSHAVAIVLHAWHQALQPSPPNSPIRAFTAAGPNWAPIGARQRLAAKVAAELNAADFRHEPELLQATLRRLTARPLEARDLRFLERILRHAAWRRQQQGEKTTTLPSDQRPTERPDVR